MHTHWRTIALPEYNNLWSASQRSPDMSLTNDRMYAILEHTHRLGRLQPTTSGMNTKFLYFGYDVHGILVRKNGAVYS